MAHSHSMVIPIQSAAYVLVRCRQQSHVSCHWYSRCYTYCACSENRMQETFPLHTVVTKRICMKNKVCAKIHKDRFLTHAMLQRFTLCVIICCHFATTCFTIYMMPANSPVIILWTPLSFDKFAYAFSTSSSIAAIFTTAAKYCASSRDWQAESGVNTSRASVQSLCSLRSKVLLFASSRLDTFQSGAAAVLKTHTFVSFGRPCWRLQRTQAAGACFKRGQSKAYWQQYLLNWLYKSEIEMEGCLLRM